MAYCAIVTWVLLFLIGKTIGLDISLHGERAYEM
jgi:hypothetical protein